jgi:hypothetical protein
MPTDSITTGVSVDLIIRSGTPSRGTIARARQLAATKVFDRVEVTLCAEEIGLSSTASRAAPGRGFLEEFATSKRWATERGVLLEPFFDTREIMSPVTGEVYAALIPPDRLMIERSDDAVTHVTPHRHERGTKTVNDRLTELERGTAETVGRDAAIAEG